MVLLLLRHHAAVDLPTNVRHSNTCTQYEGFETHPKNVRDFEILKFRLRFPDFRWDFKISRKISHNISSS